MDSKSGFLIILLFAVIIIAALFPFFFGGRIFINADSTLHYYPDFDFYSRALKNGESLLWNPQIFSGFPTYLSQSAGFLDPVNLAIFRFLPAIPAYHFRLFVDLFLVLFFSYLAGRSFGLSRLASSLIGMAYLVSFHWTYLSNLVIANSLFLLPLLFFVFTKAIQADRKKWVWPIIGGVGVGWSFLSGYAQMTVYALFLLGFYAFVLFVSNIQYRNWRYMLSAFLILSVITGVGFLTGFPQIAAVFEFVPLTVRSEGLDYSQTAFKVINPGDLILSLFPDYLYFPYLSGGRRPLYAGAFWFFLSIAALVIAVRGLRGFRRGDNSPSDALPAVSTLFIFTLLASFKWSPIFYFFNKLPVFSYFRFPYRWMYWGTWFLAVLGAFGFDYIREYRDSRWLKRLISLMAIVIGGIVSGISLLNFGGRAFLDWTGDKIHLFFSKTLYGNLGFNKDPAHYRDAISRGFAEWQNSASLIDLSFLVPLIILVAAFFLLTLFVWKKISWERFRMAGFLLSIATFLGIFVVQWPESISSDVTFSHKKLVSRFIPVEDRILYRTYPFFLYSGFAKLVPPQYTLNREELLALTELQHAGGWPNMHIYSGISSVDGYDVFVPQTYVDVLKKLESTHAGETNANGPSDESVRQLLENLDALGMMAGKYIISGVQMDGPYLNFLGEYIVSRYNIPIYVYENKKVLPRIYFAKNVVSAPGKSLLYLIDEGRRDFAKYTYLDCDRCGSVNSGGKAVFEILSLKNGFLRVKTGLTAPRWLVFSESYLPGWRAEIDGAPAALVRANGLYMAVEIPEGDHKVTFEYNGIIGEAGILKKLGIIKINESR